MKEKGSQPAESEVALNVKSTRGGQGELTRMRRSSVVATRGVRVER